MGRHRTFTVESVLDHAIELFRLHGYHDTSMHMIADRLGLSRGSIYTTFRDKHDLFEQALCRYGPCRGPGLDELRDAASPRTALLQVFELAIDRGGDGNHEPCLLINSSLELGADTPELARILQTAFGDLEALFQVTIERARSANEVADGVDPVHTARALLALYIGLWALLRSGGAEPILRTFVCQVQSLLPA
jgi:TetR/AcrR family transcriptional repressor of nem operon